jgi:hypothetical protein
MKRLLLAAAGLAAVGGLVVLLRPAIGHAQLPGSNPETIAVPVTQPVGGGGPAGSSNAVLQTLVPPPPSTNPGYLPTTPGYNQLPGATGKGDGLGQVYLGNAEHPCYLQEYLNRSLDSVKINDDVAVQSGCGPWMVCVYWYSGAEAPKFAHDLCLHLRTNYNLPAYVFTKGLDERKQELQRITEFVQRQRENLAKANLSCDMPLRVPLTRYEIECAVLVGGYKDADGARDALNKLKQLGKQKPMDPTQVKMHYQVIAEQGDQHQQLRGQYVPVDPLQSGMVVHNPTVPVQATSEQNASDMKLLRALNENEPYSLLKCPKPYTLVVKQFSLPVQLEQEKKKNTSMFDKFSFNWFQEKQEDYAALNAHNLAELLRKANKEAYVLHTKHCSYVFVGNYASKDDPQLKHEQDLLPQLNRMLDPGVQLGPNPWVADVPR